jgi:hypothetical protein
MSAFFVWVLVVQIHSGSSTATTVTIDNIATLEECQRVGKVMRDNATSSSIRSLCMQVKKVKQ